MAEYFRLTLHAYHNSNVTVVVLGVDTARGLFDIYVQLVAKRTRLRGHIKLFLWSPLRSRKPICIIYYNYILSIVNQMVFVRNRLVAVRPMPKSPCSFVVVFVRKVLTIFQCFVWSHESFEILETRKTNENEILPTTRIRRACSKVLPGSISQSDFTAHCREMSNLSTTRVHVCTVFRHIRIVDPVLKPRGDPRRWRLVS